MKIAFVTFIATLAIAGGTARGQDPKSHEHEHNQPPAVSEKADEQAEHKDMCMCCKAGSDMHEKMMQMMKDMKSDGKKEEKKEEKK